MIDYKVEKAISTISTSGKTQKSLALVSWNGHPAKLDLRVWRTDEAGKEVPGKGITLNREEAEKLAAALTEYLTGEPEN